MTNESPQQQQRQQLLLPLLLVVGKPVAPFSKTIISCQCHVMYCPICQHPHCALRLPLAIPGVLVPTSAQPARKWQYLPARCQGQHETTWWLAGTCQLTLVTKCKQKIFVSCMKQWMSSYLYSFTCFTFIVCMLCTNPEKMPEVISNFQGKVSALTLQTCLKPVCDKYSADTEHGTSLQRTQTFSLGLHSTSQV